MFPCLNPFAMANKPGSPRRRQTTEPYHVFKGTKNGCCDNSQEQPDDVEDCGGPQKPVQVKHVLTAAHTKKFVVAGRLFRTERESRQCHCDGNRFSQNIEHQRIWIPPAYFPLHPCYHPNTPQMNWRKICRQSFALLMPAFNTQSN